MTKEENEKLNLNQKLKIIHWLESLRWEDIDRANKNFETSFYHNKSYFLGENCQIKNAEAILLTHYLVYICDRQMDYRYVFKAGGYTVSCLVKDFLDNRADIINDKNSIKAKIKNLFYEHVKPEKKENETQKYSYFLCASLENAGDDIRTYFNNYNDKKQNDNPNEVRFSSRFMVIDILCMYKTLLTLCEEYNGSFKEFLSKSINGEKSPLLNLAEKFHELTYKGIPQLVGDKGNIVDLLTKFDNEKTEGKKIARYNAKRVWCLARDFVYHPVFKKYFKILVGEDDFKKCEDDVKSLELPGDVWNNNLTFAKCFWLNNKGADIKEDKDISKSSKYVREQYDKWCKNNNSSTADHWIPKDFDITFNFVPKMCSQDKCSNCPLSSEGKDFNKIFCHEQSGKLCTFVLYATDIEHKCQGKENCKLHRIMNE